MSPRKQTPSAPKLKRVAQNLYRLDPYGTYYLNAVIGGKLHRESLDTSDRPTAKRLLEDRLGELRRLDPLAKDVTLGGLMEEFLQVIVPSRGLKPRTIEFYGHVAEGIRKSWPEFDSEPAQGITTRRIQEWFARRAQQVSASHLNHELGVIKQVLQLAVHRRALLANPADGIRRVRGTSKALRIPKRSEFLDIVKKLRDGNRQDASDFVAVLGLSGMRLAEARALTWREVDFDRSSFTVSGGDAGTKSGEARVVPLFPGLAELLSRIRIDRGGAPSPDDRVLRLNECRGSLASACRELSLPSYTHHSMRHFFCSEAIEKGVDFKVIAAWLGHQDGGILVAQTYGHMRAEHSQAMAAKMKLSVEALPNE